MIFLVIISHHEINFLVFEMSFKPPFFAVLEIQDQNCQQTRRLNRSSNFEIVRLHPVQEIAVFIFQMISITLNYMNLNRRNHCL